MGHTAQEIVELALTARARFAELGVTKHAVERFMERGGRDIFRSHTQQRVWEQFNAQKYFLKLVIGASLALDELDRTQGKAPLVPRRVLYGSDVVTLLQLQYPPRFSTPDPQPLGLFACIKGDAVLSTLTTVMVQNNLLQGTYKQCDGTAFPLTHPLLKPKETSMADLDNKATFDWAYNFFKDNPKASVNGALKAANNAKPRIAPIQPIFAEARRRAQAERPVEAEPPKTPPAVEYKPAPFTPKLVPAVQPVVLDEVPTMATPPVPTPVSVPRSVKDVEADALGPIAKQLAEKMRELGMSSCVMTLAEEDDGGIDAEWDVSYKRSGKGKMRF